MPLDPPPLNDDGEVIPHDHAGICDSDGVIRRISPQHLVYDEKIGGKRISSLAFQPSTGDRGGMAIDLQRLIEEAGLDARAFVSSPPWIGAVRFTAQALRGEGLDVGFHPLPENPYHGEVWGGFSKRVKHRLLALAEEFVPIVDVDSADRNQP